MKTNNNQQNDQTSAMSGQRWIEREPSRQQFGKERYVCRWDQSQQVVMIEKTAGDTRSVFSGVDAKRGYFPITGRRFQTAYAVHGNRWPGVGRYILLLPPGCQRGVKCRTQHSRSTNVCRRREVNCSLRGTALPEARKKYSGSQEEVGDAAKKKMTLATPCVSRTQRSEVGNRYEKNRPS